MVDSRTSYSCDLKYFAACITKRSQNPALVLSFLPTRRYAIPGYPSGFRPPNLPAFSAEVFFMNKSSILHCSVDRNGDRSWKRQRPFLDKPRDDYNDDDDDGAMLVQYILWPSLSVCLSQLTNPGSIETDEQIDLFWREQRLSSAVVTQKTPYIQLLLLLSAYFSTTSCWMGIRRYPKSRVLRTRPYFPL